MLSCHFKVIHIIFIIFIIIPINLLEYLICTQVFGMFYHKTNKFFSKVLAAIKGLALKYVK